MKYFKLNDSDGICIEQIGNKILAMQYLIHKNNPEKTQHKVEEVISNIDKDELNLMFTSESGDIVSFDLIYTLCLTYSSICGVIKALGITQYRVYRNVVWDIWNDVKSEKTKKSLIEKEVTRDKSIEL